MSRKAKVILVTALLAVAGAAAAVAVTLGMQRGTGIAATVNGEVIYASQLDREIAAIARQYQIDLKSEQGLKQKAEITRVILDQMIEQRLILQQASRQGVPATDAQIDKALADIKANFPSEQEFNFALEQRGLTLADLRDRLRTNLTVQNLQAKVSNPTVSDAEIQKYYQEHRAEYDQPEQIHVRHILVDSEAKARLVLARLNRGEKFADIARAVSTDSGSKEQGGDLGWIRRGQLVPEFEKAAFALEPGQLSSVVKTQYGYHIIQLIERKAAQASTLDQVREQIRRQLLARKQETAFQAWLKQAKSQATIKRFDRPTQ